MNSKQAKKIRKIIGNVSDYPSQRLYNQCKKSFKKLSPLEKVEFLKNLEKSLIENTTPTKN